MLVFWTKIIFTVILIVLPVWLGTKMGVRYGKKLTNTDHSPVGSVVAAALGLFAFMLAFTFQITASRFDSRKQLLLDDMNAIRTTWLRAALLKDSSRVAVQALVREYLDVHVNAGKNKNSAGKIISRLEQIQDSLWMQAIKLADEDRSSEVYSLFISSVNDMIDLYNKRKVIIFQSRIPKIILAVLYFIAFFSMFILGFQFGLTGRGNLLIILSLALIFSAVMWLIFVLDDPTMGIIQVNREQVYELQQELHGGR